MDIKALCLHLDFPIYCPLKIFKGSLYLLFIPSYVKSDCEAISPIHFKFKQALAREEQPASRTPPKKELQNYKTNFFAL